MATSGVYGELKERSKEAALIIVGKTKEMVQSRQELRLMGITRLMWSGNSKYSGMLINDTNHDMEEI